MKKSQQTVENMVMQSHYLEALEIESRAENSLSEMERQDFIDTINGLKETISSLRISMETLRESSENNSKTLMMTIKDLQKDVEGLKGQLAIVTKERDDLKALLNRENGNRYGGTSCSRRYGKGKKRSSNDRQKDNEDWVSNEESKEANIHGTETGEPSGEADGVDQTKVKSEYLNDVRGERGKYNLMEAAKTVRLRTSLDGAPSDMKFIGYKEVKEFTKKSYVECTVFEVAVYEDKYGTRHEYYKPAEKDDTRRPYVNVVPGTHSTPELLADLAIENKMMFIPIYRESIRHALDCFQISRNTDRNWLNIGAKMLNPIMKLLKDRLLKVKSILNIDETWTKIRIKFAGDGTKLGSYAKKYIWVLVNKIEGITYFFYDNDENDSRGLRPIQTFLGDFLGAIQSDGYAVYKHLSGQNPGNDHLMCWAHVHNKFEQVFKACKDKDADLMVKRIGNLYRIEGECILAHMTPDEIKKRRNQPDVKKILESLYKRGVELLNQKRKHYSEMMRKALRYMVDNFDALTEYLKDGRYTIDNLPAERAIRPFTVYRKNSLFFSSEEGVETAMTYHTIIETCKNLGLNARDYLVTAFRESMKSTPDYASINPCLLAGK